MSLSTDSPTTSNIDVKSPNMEQMTKFVIEDPISNHEPVSVTLKKN